MKFKDLSFINGKCQLDYNYYVLSFSQIENEKLYECAVFNRAKLPVDLPSVKTEKIKNNKALIQLINIVLPLMLLGIFVLIFLKLKRKKYA